MTSTRTIMNTNTKFVTILLLAIMLFATRPAPLLAAQPVVAATPAPIPGFSVSRNEATASFPQGITFFLDATSEMPIADVALLFNTPGTLTLSVELPRFDEGATSLAIEHPVSLDAGQLPPGLDVLYHWRITDANGDVTETEVQTIPWIDSRYDWTPLEGPRVTVYAYDMPAEFQQATLDSAERTIDRLVEAYGFEPQEHIRLWAYAHTEDLYCALAPNSEPWIAGSAYPPLYLIMAILPVGDYDELARVVPHEITHQVEHQVTKNPFNSPPLWLSEGLAVYWQETGRDRFYTYALQIASEGDAPPLRTLNGGFDYNPDGALAAYALSLSAVIYILDTWGDEGMANLLGAFREGISFDDAIKQSLGVTFDELDAGWQAYVKEKAEELLPAGGSTQFSDDPVGPGSTPAGSSFWQEVLVASGTLILGLVVVIALLAGGFAWWRTRREQNDEHEQDDDHDLPQGPRWREWPEGLEPPSWEPRSAPSAG